jgi:hypothetical protein
MSSFILLTPYARCLTDCDREPPAPKPLHLGKRQSSGSAATVWAGHDMCAADGGDSDHAADHREGDHQREDEPFHRTLPGSRLLQVRVRSRFPRVSCLTPNEGKIAYQECPYLACVSEGLSRNCSR